MEKSLLFIGLVILSIGVCLSGCNERKNNENQPQDLTAKFLGDWEFVRSEIDYEIWSFCTNGSARDNITQDEDGQSITSEVWYDYSIDNTSICFSTKNESVDSPNYISICFTYNFSENATRLTLSSNNIVIMDLEKIT
jgi:hypothetical protein